MALNNVPLAGQNLSQTRDPIRGNFTTIDTTFSVDHATYNTTGAGWHNKITFPVQTIAPTFAAGNNGLYSRARNAINEVYIHKQSAAGVQEIPLAASILSFSTPGSNSNGWTYLPSGIIIKWRSVTLGAGFNTVTITSGAGEPNFTALFHVQFTLGSLISCYLNGISGPNQFQVTANPGGIIYYYAIGR